MGMSPEQQTMMMAQQQGGPAMQQQMDPAMMEQGQPPVDPAMMGQDQAQQPGFADQYAQQFQDIPPELLQQLAGQGIDPAMQPPQQEAPDPVTTAMMLTFEVYEQVLQDQQLNLDVRAKTAHTYAQALKTLSDIQNVGADQQQQLDPELQFQMEMQRMEMQMQADQQKLQMEAQMMQLEMQFKVQEAELKLQIMREQAQLKADQDRAKAELELDRKQDEHILNMAQKEESEPEQPSQSE